MRQTIAIDDAIGYTKFYSRSHDAVIRVYNSDWQRDRNAQSKTSTNGGTLAPALSMKALVS
jgi:hypothetical protein